MSSIKTVNPATNVVEKEYPTMSQAQVETILENADEAFQSWKNVSFSERAKLINGVARLLREQKNELARLFTIEMGKLYSESIWEVDFCADMFEYFAANAENFLADEPIKTSKGSAFLSYEPIGVILSIQPWNFPYYQITRSAAPNIMAGNTIVLKHASNVPQSAEAMERIFTEAGAPKGVYTNLFIPGSQMSEIAADPRIKGVSLTGSGPAGSSIASVAGKYIKKSILELGGSDAFIVMPDADIDKALETAIQGRLFNAGQVCTSSKRIIIPESIADEFIGKAKNIFENLVVGDPLDSLTQLAPLSSEKAVQEVMKQVSDSIHQGATLVAGGKRIERPGAFMEPTILTGIEKGMRAYSEEIFGPVFAIYVVKDIDEAVSLANDSEFGLGGVVFGKDTQKAVEIARRMDTGMVFINHVTDLVNELPFGGTKNSGYGREHARNGILEFVNKKLICVAAPEKK